jgi:4-hydroxythreonine-4-phosphate dehydrogenase
VSSPVIGGQLNTANADYVLESIKIATQGCLSGQFQAMVTGPVNKAIINQAGHNFSGHTEFIAELCDQAFPVMLLANEKMRVALVTTHLPLAKVSEHITAIRLEKVITIAASDLTRRFGITRPRLLVCGLNPHAGEQGHLGDEEINIIIPTLNSLRETGLLITGPVPADTAFTPDSLRDIDLVIAMYHDQGLPVLKSHGFGDTVNITLGLPIIRTSVDHGTALDLVGTGKASSSSLSNAIHQAITLAKNEMMKPEVAITETGPD